MSDTKLRICNPIGLAAMGKFGFCGFDLEQRRYVASLPLEDEITGRWLAPTPLDALGVIAKLWHLNVDVPDIAKRIEAGQIRYGYLDCTICVCLADVPDEAYLKNSFASAEHEYY